MKKNKVIGLSLATILALQVGVFAQSEEKQNMNSLESVDVIASEEDTESYTVKSMNTSTKLNLSIKDTPQLVTVVTKQKLEDLGISSYQDLMSHITGVTLNQADERMFPTARGFAVDYYQIDGIPTYTISDYVADDLDLSLYERIEVVKGANGLMTGAGNPAISMNFVRKRADSKETKVTADLSAGSWDNYKAEIDLTVPLNDNGSIRGRTVLKYETKDTFMDNYKKDNTTLYGVIDADLTDTTYLSVGASYQNLERSGVRWGGLPAFYSDGSKTNYNRSQTFSSDWTKNNIETKNFFVDLKQILSDDISLNLSYSHKRIDTDSALLYFYGRADKHTGIGEGIVYKQSGVNNKREHNADVYISVPFSTNTLEHELILGAMYNKDQETGGGNYRETETASSANQLVNFKHLQISNPNHILNSRVPNTTKQTAAYIVGKLTLSEQLKLVSGARLTNWEYESDDKKGNRKFDNEITPYIGFVYNLNQNHSVYTSYTSIFQPQDKQTENGDYLDPIVGKSYEAGIKGEYFDGKLNATFSLFRIEQDKVAEAIDNVKVIDTGDQAYRAAEGVTSKGIEINLAGKLHHNLSLDFGLASFEAKEANGDKYNTTSSRHTINIFSKYSFNKVSIGGGFNYKSKYYTGTGNNKITQDAYTIVNLMSTYKVNNNLNVQFNVNNLFDKTYYSGIGGNSMVYGSPRNYTASLKYSF